MRRAETWIEDALADFSRQGLARHLSAYQNTGTELSDGTRCLVNFSSNDYLGLAHHPRVIEAGRKALDHYGAGATASRLVVGTLPCHEELEQRLASLKGYPAALLFGNGYAANMGIISALVGRGDHIFMDRLAHASLVDAAILSRARVHRFQHNDVDHCSSLIRSCASGRGQAVGSRRLLITESVFSMDGDLAPVSSLAALAEREGLMMLVDEAHATGVFGPGGAGLIRAAGVESCVNLSMGTLSKALGGYGGFTACSTEMRQWLIQRARSFIYSTALPPAVAGAATGALDVVRDHPDMGATLLARARAFRERLKAGGLDTGASQSQIIPVMAGDNDCALRVHRRLLAEGILAVPIRPPTVPRGTARLRLSVTLGHTPELLDRVAGMIVEAFRAEGGAS
jgi:8-amino-7-oxononanoate synthase